MSGADKRWGKRGYPESSKLRDESQWLDYQMRWVYYWLRPKRKVNQPKGINPLLVDLGNPGIYSQHQSLN